MKSRNFKESPMELGITGIHHVQIGVRPEDEAACRRFYGGILGMKEAPKPVPSAKTAGPTSIWRGSSFTFRSRKPRKMRPAAGTFALRWTIWRGPRRRSVPGSGDRSRPPAHRGVGAVLCARSGGGPGRVRPGAAGL